MGPGQSHQLPLTDRQRLATFPYPGIQASSQAVHPVRQVQGVEGGLHITRRGVGTTKPDVLGDRRVEQEPVLGDHPYGPTPVLG